MVTLKIFPIPVGILYFLVFLLHVWNLELSPFPTNLMVSDLPYSFKCFVGKVIFREHRPSKPIWYNLQLHVVSPRHLLQYKGPNNLENALLIKKNLNWTKTWGLNCKNEGSIQNQKQNNPPICWSQQQSTMDRRGSSFPCWAWLAVVRASRLQHSSAAQNDRIEGGQQSADHSWNCYRSMN